MADETNYFDQQRDPLRIGHGHHVPLLTDEEVRRKMLLAAGMGIGAAGGVSAGTVGAGIPGVAAGLGTMAAGAGYLPGALAMHGIGAVAGGVYGAHAGYQAMRQQLDNAGDAERQPGGFYGGPRGR